MPRVLLVLAVLTAFVAGTVMSSTATGQSQAAAKKKCKKTHTLKKGKCVKKKTQSTSSGLKDGEYTYKQAAAGSAPVNTLRISGKGTKVTIREMFFSSGKDPADNDCAATMIDLGTWKLRKIAGTKDMVEWSSPGTGVTVPPVQVLGAGGGTGTTSGQINLKTLVVNVNTNVVMKNANGGSGCHEGHSYEQTQKLKPVRLL